MEELNTPVFAQAKVEYTAQLVDLLYSHMFDGVKSIYEESKMISSSRSNMPILLVFRELLEKVPIWNSEIIDSECSRIISNTQCDWIDDLITAVFISHTKILTSIGPNQSFQKINVTIPKTSTFIHKSYINTAREIWKNPYLFNERVPGHEFQKNNKEIENIIKKCIENTIRNLLPIKEILREHLEGETDSIINQKETLKQLLRDELKNIGINQSDNDNYSYDSMSDNGTDYQDIDQDIKDKELREKEVADSSASSVSSSNNLADNLPGNLPNIINENESSVDVSLRNEGDLTNEESSSNSDHLSNLYDKIKGIVGQNTSYGSQSDSQPVANAEPTYHGDPSAAQVAKNCSEIIVNDITIPVEIPDETGSSSSVPIIPEPTIPEPTPEPTIPVEVKYDNVNAINMDKNVDVDPDRVKRLMTNMEVKEDINVIKSVDTAGPIDMPAKSGAFSFNNLYNNMNNSYKGTTPPTTTPPTTTPPTTTPPTTTLPTTTLPTTTLPTTTPPTTTPPTTTLSKESVAGPVVPPLQIITEGDVVIPNEPKSPRKDMVVVKNEDDIDDTSSLANFFDDVKKIVEDKGIIVEKNNDKSFTLFEDASEVDK